MEVLKEVVVSDLLSLNKINSYVIHEDILNLIGPLKLTTLPLRLPMIVEPKPYYVEPTLQSLGKESKKSIIRLGGYLLNDELFTDNIFFPKHNLRTGPSIYKDDMYTFINKISGIGYKINTDMLNFVKLHGVKLGMIHTLEEITTLRESSNSTKAERRTIDSLQNKFDLEQNILGIADVFKDIPNFYIPVRMDSRGRIYCISNYLNYQSTDLAKSLLLFSKAEVICKTDKRAFQ
jgi:hypothetical protein